jgi:hypothetical protein
MALLKNTSILIIFSLLSDKKKRLTFCAQAARAFTFFVHEIKIIRCSRFPLRSNSTAKKSKQKMPLRKEIPKNQIVFLKSENSLRSNNSDLPHYRVCFQRHSVNSQARFLTKNNLIFLTEFL